MKKQLLFLPVFLLGILGSPAQTTEWSNPSTLSCKNLSGKEVSIHASLEIKKLESKGEKSEDGNTKILFRADNVWERHFGYKMYYQMLLDADAEALGTGNPWNPSFGFPAIGTDEEAYALAEYKIPANSSPDMEHPTGLAGNCDSLEVPAGIYDIAIILPDSSDDYRYWCNQGFFDDFVLEEGAVYEFHVADMDGYDQCFVTADVPDDLALLRLSSPISGADLGSQEHLVVEICNNGDYLVPSSSASLRCSVDGKEAFEEDLPIEIPIGDTLEYTLSTPVDLSTIGEHRIHLELIYDQDGLLSNNTLETTVEKLQAVETLPYVQDFSSPDGAWTIYDFLDDLSVWTHNAQEGYTAPGCMYDLMPANGGSDDWLISPPIQLEAGEAYMTFYYRSSHARYSASLEVWFGSSLDLSGMQLQTAQTAWTTEWVLLPVNVQVPESGTYHFAIRNTTGQDMSSLYIDDVTINQGSFTGIPDISVDRIILPVAGCGLENTAISAVLSNHGSEPIGSFELEYSINGGEALSHSFNDLPIGATRTFTFPQAADFSEPGRYDIALMAFNPSQTSPIIWLEDDPSFNAGFAPYAGNRYGVSFQSAAEQNDDWLISPKLRVGKGSEFVFHVSYPMEGLGVPEFQAYVSTTGNNPEDFEPLGDKMTAPAGIWEEIRFSLDEYAGQEIHVAIRCVSTLALMFMVDDLEVTKASSNEQEDLALNLHLYPNPARDFIQISTSASGIHMEQVEIFSIQGTRLFASDGNLHQEYFRYDTSGLDSGIYFARVRTNLGTATLKFIVL